MKTTKPATPPRSDSEAKNTALEIREKVKECLSRDSEMTFALETMRSMQVAMSEKAKNLLRRHKYISSK